MKRLRVRRLQFHRDFFESVLLGVYRVTSAGRLVFANPAFARILGYKDSREAVASITDVSRHLYADPGQRDVFLELLHRQGFVADFEVLLRRKGGQPIWIAVHARPQYGDKGELLLIEGAITNIEKRKRAEEALAGMNRHLEQLVQERTRDLLHKAEELAEANHRLTELDRMKSAFLSSVSHELRSPLTSVLGFAKLIDKSFQGTFLPLARDTATRQKGARLCDNLRIITQESERLTRLINDLLDLTRIENGRATLHEEWFPVGQLLDRSVDAIAALFEEKPAVRMRLEAPADLPGLVGDIDRLQQVLLNLLNNACKFTESGEVTLCAAMAPDGGVVFTVRDTGVGIAPAELERVFDKFYQVTHDDTLHGKPQGSGLGLAICRQIMECSRGRIWAESTVGKGSAFYVHLPPEMVMDAPAGRCPLAPGLRRARDSSPLASPARE